MNFDALYITNFQYLSQLFLFFIIKIPIIFLNAWLLKTYIEFTLDNSIILFNIVLKINLWSILRFILLLLLKVYLDYIYLVYLIKIISIINININILKIINIKKFITYLFIFHALIYL